MHTPFICFIAVYVQNPLLMQAAVGLAVLHCATVFTLSSIYSWMLEGAQQQLTQ